jgi:hypothetical protein
MRPDTLFGIHPKSDIDNTSFHAADVKESPPDNLVATIKGIIEVTIVVFQDRRARSG